MDKIKQAIIETFTQHMGKVITYTPHKDLPETERCYGKFSITEKDLQSITYCNLEKINDDLKATDDVWAPLADIYWGQGYHSVLYGNASGVMFVKNGDREYVSFDA